MLAIGNWYKTFEYQILEKRLGSHINIGPVTFYGFNAMALAVNIKTSRWGYICFAPSIYFRGMWWRWKFYISPDATPSNSTFAIGPGIDHQ